MIIIYNKKSPKSLILKGIWGIVGDWFLGYAVKLTVVSAALVVVSEMVCAVVVPVAVVLSTPTFSVVVDGAMLHWLQMAAVLKIITAISKVVNLYNFFLFITAHLIIYYISGR
jgi:hypothetical protein